ncbi:hypothetical protein [Conexibacter sp. SYSU D00693]|uniref:hypothetical protein n=1 Tax=Conexibacter sp. SYSU D00693 TaxID=2812560 RepID=UPI00196A9A35|nr:hypothetical protein [Conexibacter sp. SYSU D00693]
MRDALRRLPPLAATATAVLAALVFLGIVAPTLLQGRSFVSSTPTSEPRTAVVDVPVPAGSEVCAAGFGLSPDAAVAQIAGRAEGPLPPVALTLSAPGFRATGSLEAGWASGPPVRVPLSRSPGRELDGARLCVRNRGRVAFDLLGADEPRGLAPGVTVTRDGRPTGTAAQPWIVLRERGDGSLLGKAGEVSRRIDATRPTPRLLLHLLLLAVVVGAPIALTVAVLRASRADAAADAVRPRL